MQSEEHRGFQRITPAHDPNQCVDVLRAKFKGTAARWNQILPDKRHGIIEVETRCKSCFLET
jgi:hypothetical protein